RDVVLALAARLELGQHLLVRWVEGFLEVLHPELVAERLLVVRGEVRRPVEEIELILDRVRGLRGRAGRWSGARGLPARRGRRGRGARRRGCRGRRAGGEERAP